MKAAWTGKEFLQLLKYLDIKSKGRRTRVCMDTYLKTVIYILEQIVCTQAGIQM